MDKQAAYRAIIEIKAELITPKPYGRGSEFWNTPPTIRDILSRRARGLWVYVLATRDPDVIRAAQSISISDVEGLLAMDLPPQYLDHAKVCLGVLRDIAAMDVIGELPATVNLPDKLDTAAAHQIIQAMITEGFIDGTPLSPRWVGQINELAAFIDLSSEALGLRPSNKRVPWQIYKQKFTLPDKTIQGAKSAKNDYDNKRQVKPEKWGMIKSICEKQALNQ